MQNVGPIQTYLDVSESATFSFRVRLSSTCIWRIWIFLSTLSRVENIKSARNSLTCEQGNFWIGPTRKEKGAGCGFKHIRICVDGALVISRSFTLRLQRTTQKCSKIINARAHPLFFSLNLLFAGFLAAVTFVVFLRSRTIYRNVTASKKYATPWANLVVQFDWSVVILWIDAL